MPRVTLSTTKAGEVGKGARKSNHYRTATRPAEGRARLKFFKHSFRSIVPELSQTELNVCKKHRTAPEMQRKTNVSHGLGDRTPSVGLWGGTGKAKPPLSKQPWGLTDSDPKNTAGRSYRDLCQDRDD